MGNAIINFTRSTNAYTAMILAKSILGAGTSGGAVDFLGTSDEDIQTVLPFLFNGAQRELVSKNPLWFRTSGTLDIVSGSRQIDIPTDILDLDIFWVGYVDEDGQYMDNYSIQYLPLSEIRRQAPLLMQSSYTQDWPQYITINPTDNGTGGKLEVYGLPSSDRTLKTEWRIKDSPFTYADISGPTSVTFVMCPDALMEVFAEMLAARLAPICWGANDPRVAFHVQRAGKMNDEWALRFANPPLRMASKRLQTSGNTTGFSGSTFPGFRKRTARRRFGRDY